MPGQAQFIYIIKLNCTCAGSAVYIIRSYNRVNQLHESRWCMDLLSHKCLNRWRIYCHVRLWSVILSFWFPMRLFCCVWIGTSFLKCKGICEYVRVPSYLPLARKVVAFLTCGALCNVAFVFDCSPVFFTSSANLWSCCLCLRLSCGLHNVVKRLPWCGKQGYRHPKHLCEWLA